MRSRRAWSKLALCLAAAALAGCNCGPAGEIQVPSSPVGSIAGRVTSLRDGSPLGGVTVKVLQVGDGGAVEISVTTGEDGAFALRDLPAGTSYRVRFSLDGYVPRFVDTVIPDSAGEYPQGNAVAEVNTAMAPNTASITGKIIASGAKPAAGATVGIDLRGAGYELVAEAVADADGVYTLSGLPASPTGVPVTIVVQPYDENNDGQADYGVVQVSSLAFPGITTRTEIDLRSAASALVLLATDMDDGQHQAADPMDLVFNRPIDPNRLDVSLTDLDRGRAVGVGFALDASRSNLTVTPSGGPLAQGVNYRLTVSARADNGASNTSNRFFQAVGGPSSGLPAVTGLTVKPTEADWNTVTFNLTWNHVPGASAYRVYAKDSISNPSYVQLATIGSKPTPATTVTLPASFDTFAADSVQTPLAYGAKLDFAVVPVDAMGQSPDPATATAVTRSDTTAPKIVSATQSGSADNTSGTAAKTVKLTVHFTEYMDAVAPNIALPATLTATYELQPTLLDGVFTITVPAGTNGVGAFQITAGKDTSGLPLIAYDGTLKSAIEYVTNGGFEACALTGWTPINSGSASAPAAVSDASSAGTCSARLGNATFGTTNVPQLGSSVLYQTFTIASGTSATLSLKYRPFTTAPGSVGDAVYCYLQTSGGSHLLTLFYDYTNDASFKAVSQDVTAYIGMGLRIYCNAYQNGSYVTGMYLDEVSVLATP